MGPQISWKALATTSACVNLALIVALAVTVASGGADFLSTLALALAVVAFVVQIIIFIAQTSFASGQLVRAEEVHGSTMRALAAIEEKAEGTRQTVNTMSDHMLAALVDKSTPPGTHASRADSGEEVGRRVADLIAGTAPEAAPAETPPVSQNRSVRVPTNATLPLPTGERMRHVSEVLGRLTDQDLVDLEWVAQDYLRYGNAAPGGVVGHGVSEGTVSRSLYDVGLAKKVRATWGRKPTVWVLTDLGKDAAAVLLAPSVPDDAPEGALKARQKRSDEAANLAAFIARQEAAVRDVPVED